MVRIWKPYPEQKVTFVTIAFITSSNTYYACE